MKTAVEKQIECNEYWANQPYPELVKVYHAIQRAKKHGFKLMKGDYMEASIIIAMENKIIEDNHD